MNGGRDRESEEGDAVLRWLRADIVCLICHLQVCAYYREAKSEQNVRCVCVFESNIFKNLKAVDDMMSELLFTPNKSSI